MKTFQVCASFLAIFTLINSACDAYRILGLFPLPGKSHLVMFDELMKGLTKKGHEVDVMSCFPPKKSIPRYNHISLEGVFEIYVNNLSVALIQETMKTSFDASKFILSTMGHNVCRKTLNTTAAHDILKSSKKYDLLITEIFATDCMLGFAHRLNIPSIGIISSVNLPWASDRIGTFDNPSYIPNYFAPYLTNMDFFERLFNTVSLLIYKYIYQIETAVDTEIAREFFGQDLPDLTELAKTTSLILVNSHLSANVARPSVPNFIEVGGLHIGSPKALPKHLEDAINVSPPQYEGVIYLSMGSMITTESFPIDTLQAMMDAFKELSSYKVIWKASKERMPKEVTVPSNVELYHWLPQLDVLCHPKVKMFVSHGGLMGSQEAIYCGVPRLGIPFFADQELNVRQSEIRNLSIMVKYETITKESFLKAAKSLLHDPKYKESASKMSQLFKDRPLKPLDTAIYWVEHVIRTNGAPHLRNVGADLPWYQYYLIDVGAALLLLIATFAALSYHLFIFVFRQIFQKKQKSD